MYSIRKKPYPHYLKDLVEQEKSLPATKIIFLNNKPPTLSVWTEWFRNIRDSQSSFSFPVIESDSDKFYLPTPLANFVAGRIQFHGVQYK